MIVFCLFFLIDDPPDFHPVNIFGNTTVKAGENIQFKCTISGKREFGNIYMYLCRNGAGVMMELLKDKDEHTFILRNVSLLDSGNYSCVYSLNKHPPNYVRTSGHDSIQVYVTGKVMIFFQLFQ